MIWICAASICAASIGTDGASRAAESTDAATTVNPWATGGVPGVPKPADGTQAPMAYWQAPALPQAVITGGAIPAGWTPQAVPYTGMGPDGKPLTMYYAPTYVFTYQVGPPVIAAATAPAAQVNRRQALPAPQPVAMQGWNYQTQGAPASTYALPPATVARYQPVPYQYPPGAQQLAGMPIVPPAGPPPAPVAPPVSAPPLAPPLAPPPSQWGPVPQQQPVAPPQWGPSAEPPPALVPQPAAPPAPAADAFAAAAVPAMAGTAGAIAAQQPPPPQPMVAPIGSPAAGVPATQTASAGQAARPGNTHLWRVVGVHDGDTITCLDESNQQQKVRLASIDAPEIGQEYGKVARENLAAMIFGKTVEVVDEGKDRYGRWVGRVSSNGQDINREMIATGNAWHFAEYSNDASLAALEQQAQQRRAGLWATSNPTPPWDYREQMKRPST